MRIFSTHVFADEKAKNSPHPHWLIGDPPLAYVQNATHFADDEWRKTFLFDYETSAASNIRLHN